jgi:hypothetical protein
VTLYRLADNLAIRVGRDGIWIWAPDVSDRPFHLDPRTLTDMGLHLGSTAGSVPPDADTGSIPPPRDPIRTA